MTAKLKRGITKVKDPGSALTHFIAMILAIIAARCSQRQDMTPDICISAHWQFSF